MNKKRTTVLGTALVIGMTFSPMMAYAHPEKKPNKNHPTHHHLNIFQQQLNQLREQEKTLEKMMKKPKKKIMKSSPQKNEKEAFQKFEQSFQLFKNVVNQARQNGQTEEVKSALTKIKSVYKILDAHQIKIEKKGVVQTKKVKQEKNLWTMETKVLQQATHKLDDVLATLNQIKG